MVFTEFRGRGYGRTAIDLFKDQYAVIVADRVRHRAIGFWTKMGFTQRQDGNWEYRRAS